MKHKKAPPLAIEESPRRQRVIPKVLKKTIRKQKIDHVYFVRSIDAEGRLFKTKIYRLESGAVDFAIRLKIQLETSAPHLTVYVEKMKLSPAPFPDHILNSLKTEGVSASRREAETVVFGYTDIPEVYE